MSETVLFWMGKRGGGKISSNGLQDKSPKKELKEERFCATTRNDLLLTPFTIVFFFFLFLLLHLTSHQFHQCFTNMFFVRKSFWQLFSSYVFGFVIFGAKILYEKGARKVLMKLTPGVDFTNIPAAFIRKDPKSAKIQSSHYCLFMLLRSLLTKTAGVNFVTILLAAFLYQIVLQSFSPISA
jgi:hypothetical protein